MGGTVQIIFSEQAIIQTNYLYKTAQELIGNYSLNVWALGNTNFSCSNFRDFGQQFVD